MPSAGEIFEVFLLVVAAAAAIAALAHTAPFPFVLDHLYGGRVLWRMPHDGRPPTVYLTFDDGPNPEVTPGLLDLLARERVPATFFLIERHLTAETQPIVQRMAAEGHALALHSHTRHLMLMRPSALKAHLSSFADRLTSITGAPPCRAFRPHAGWRGSNMLAGLAEMDYRLVGWGWMLWDWDFFRPRDVGIVPRLVRQASPGDIVVIHDGHHENPRADRRSAIDIAARLIPALRAKGLGFGTVCP
ncbi:MAG: polysaccharide deacetylase family protein [Acidobacteria bacterium]|nr:polysaccharide deacetylase family protein [Acidobacteriota bacterium]